MALAAKKGGLDFDTEVGKAAQASDVIFIAVGTPPLPNGEPNLGYLEAAARNIGAAMDASKFRVVVNKSTVPVGSGTLVETLVREGIEETRPAEKKAVRFGVASNPEFLREGAAVGDSLYPDRIVVGASDEATVLMMRELYEPLVTQKFEPPPGVPRPNGMISAPLLTTSISSAEMIKYASNAFLSIKIGFANEMANLCERVGAEATEVMTGIGLDSRIGSKFLNPGVGWGGSCFGKDVSALLHTAREYGYETKLLQASIDVNVAQRSMVIAKLQEKLYIMKGRTIGVLGLAFKPDTDDLRDAPALYLIEKLLAMGARIKAHDPVAMEACKEQNPGLKIKYCDTAEEVADEADALLLTTEWRQYRQLDLSGLAKRMNRAILVDGRNVFNPDEAIAAGFDYTGIGRRVRQAKRPAAPLAQSKDAGAA